MKNIGPIFLKDLRSFFFSMTAYVVIAIFILITGYFFASAVSYFSLYSFQIANQPEIQAQGLNLTEAVLDNLLFNYSIIMLLMIPVITMRSFSEEQKTGTFELLFTYPVSEAEVVLGKFLACFSVFLLMIAPTLIYLGLVWRVGGTFDGGVISAGYLGILLLGAAFVSLGIFTSSLTENQIVSAVLSFGVLLFFWIIGWSGQFLIPPLAKMLDHISLVNHFEDFVRGVIELRHIAYYVFFVLFFLIVTCWRLEARRWQ